MRVRIVAAGRARPRAVRELLDDYYARIGRYADFDEVEVRDPKGAGLFTAVDRAVALLGGRADVVGLDVKGMSLSSEGLAGKIGATVNAARDLVFVVGGYDGMDASIRAKAKWELSLGPLTLPHRLARVVLAEQIYRAFTILRGEPYARED